MVENRNIIISTFLRFTGMMKNLQALEACTIAAVWQGPTLKDAQRTERRQKDILVNMKKRLKTPCCSLYTCSVESESTQSQLPTAVKPCLLMRWIQSKPTSSSSTLTAT